MRKTRKTHASKPIARGHKDARRKKRSAFIMFVGRFNRRTLAGINATAKARKISAAAALRHLADQALGLGKAAEQPAPRAKSGAASPLLVVTGPNSISIKLHGRKPVAVRLPAGGLEPGADYGICLQGKRPVAEKLTTFPGKKYLGGFHFAAGGNATADRGGDDKPAINPFSIWDKNFRPACPDPRGMALVDVAGKKVWVDIYLLAADHLAGTSRFGVTIADGDDPPESLNGGRFTKLDYATAVTVMQHHGKGLLSPGEFYAAAAGVTERSSAESDPKITGLDAGRTSKFGLMQATGNLWVWGHDGTPEKRASIFGGSWWGGRSAGSRCAGVASHWPDNSGDGIGARGRSDHLQPV